MYCKTSEIYTLHDENGVGKFIKFGRLRWVGHVMRIKKSDPANKVFRTKLGRIGDKRGGGSTSLRMTQHCLGVEIAELMCSQERSGRSSLSRSPIQGCSANGGGGG